MLPEALAAAKARISYGFIDTEVLKTLAPRLPKKKLLPEAFAIALDTWELNHKILYLKILVPYLTPKSLLKIIKELVEDEYNREGIFVESGGIGLLKELLPFLPKNLLSEALEASRTIADEPSKAKTLKDLIPYLPEVSLEALEAAENIPPSIDNKKELALKDLVPYLPLSKGLEVFRKIKSERYQAEALKNLIPNLPLFDALKAITIIKNNDIRAEIFKFLLINKIHFIQSLLSITYVFNSKAKVRFKIKEYKDNTSKALDPHLTLSEVLKKVKIIDNEKDRTEALREFFKRLTLEEIDYALWLQTLDVLASLSRKNFLELLPHLAPLIRSLLKDKGGNEALALKETVNAVNDVCKWWK